ncbi:MAG: hypothetical protein RLZZ77_1133 [Bacteroidota bacterium]|jgi:hypothetical protein
MKAHLLKVLPHAVAILLFVALSSAFFSPLWKGYELRQGDIDNWRGMSQEANNFRALENDEALWTNSMFAGMPAYQISVVHTNNFLRIVDNVLRLGLPRPVGTMFLCMLGFYIFALCLRIRPWLAIAGGAAFGLATINILYLGAGHTGKVHAIAYMAPTLGAMILAFRGRALLGAALFALFLGLNIYANHLQMTYYLVFIVGLVGLGEMIRLIIGKEIGTVVKVSAFLIAGGVLALLPNLSNLLATYEYSKYTTRGETELTIKASGEEKSQAEKTGLEESYILQYNYAKGEQWSMFIPNARGGKSGAIGNDKEILKSVDRQFKENISQQNAYWGGQYYTGGAFYFGAAVLFLFVLALIFAKDWIKWPFLVLTLMALMLCVKDMTALNDFFIHHVPMYNKFRDSKMILVLIQIMAPALGLLFVNEILDEQDEPKRRKFLLIGTAALFVVVLALRFAPGTMGEFLSDQDVEQFTKMEDEVKGDAAQLAMIDEYRSALISARTAIYEADASRTLLVVVMIVAVFVLTVFRKLPAIALAAALALIFIGDLWTVDARYLNEDKVKGQFRNYVSFDEKLVPHRPNKVDEYILNVEKQKIQNFDQKVNELKEALKKGEYAFLKKSTVFDMVAQFGVLNQNSSYRVLPMGDPFSDASTSYFHKSLGGYHGAKLKRYQELIEFCLQPEMATMIDSLKSGGEITVLSRLNAINMLNTKYILINPEMPPLENPYACGNAWFVSKVRTVADANTEIKELETFDPKSEVLLDQRMAGQLKDAAGLDSTALITMTEYSPKLMRYTSHSPVEAPAVFSEIYYPEGWVCRVDGNEVPIVRVNYLLRGAMIPAGDHTIEMSFEPSVFSTGGTISLVGSILLLLAAGAAIGLALRDWLKAA